MTNLAELKERAKAGDTHALQQLRESGFFAQKKAAQSGYALSHAQLRLWLLQQMEGGEVAYAIPNAILLEGALDPNVLEASLRFVVARHEALRTTFALVGDEPRQFIQEADSFRLEWRELSQLPDPLQAAKELARQDAMTPFDLVQGPLFRAQLLRLAEDRHLLLVNVHHIVFDAISAQILLGEVASCYNAINHAGGQPNLPALRIQYKEYAAWQNSRLNSPEIERSRLYWHEQLGGDLPVLDLPNDAPRPPILTYDGAVVSISLPAAQVDRLTRLGWQEGATRYMVLVALVKLLLHRYSGQNDLITGMAIAGRNQPELENQIGFFVNTLALRDRVEGEESFVTLLNRVSATIEVAFAHQEYPFDLLISELKLVRDPSRSPIFDVMVNLEHYAPVELHLGKAQLSTLDVGFIPAKFDLLFNFAESAAQGGDLQLAITYNRNLFSAERMQRMAGHLAQLLASVIQQPNLPIQQLSLLTTAESEQILRQFNNTLAAYPVEQTITSLFEAQAATTPQRIAVSFANRQLSYATLNQLANRVAWQLRQQGLQPGETVALFLERSEWTIVAILAVLKAGGVYVPLDITYPQERNRYMLEDCGCRLVISEASLFATLADCLPPGFSGDGRIDIQSAATASQMSAENLMLAINPDQPAYIIYTSGSTGKPKGCLVTHRNVVRLMKNEAHDFDFSADDVWVVAHSFSFDFSVWEMYGALLYGGRVVVAQREVVRDVAQFLALIKTEGVTVLNQTPAAFYSLISQELSEPAHTLDRHLRYVIFGGDRLDPAYLRPWTARYPTGAIQLINMYGITETTVHVTFYRLTDADIAGSGGRSPIGRPLPETQVYICNSAQQLQPIGVPGEICVGGSGVSLGYLNRPQLTDERFVANPFAPGKLYRSGDLGRFLPNGELEHLGRLDHQVKVRGFRIELGEIEAVLQQHPAVKEVFVMLHEDPANPEPANIDRANTASQGGRLVAYIVPNEQKDETPPQSVAESNPSQLRQELRGFVQQRAPEYMVPAAFVLLEALPLTANNKVDRRALPSPEAVAQRPQQSIVAPRDDLERVVAGIWHDVLKVMQVSIHDNFFEIGGHSLKAMQILSRLQASFKIKLSLSDLFRASTVAELCTVLRKQEPIPGQVDKIARALERIRNMSDEEKARLLAQRNKQ